MVLKINEINEQVFAKLELMPSGTGSLQGDRYTGKFLAPILCLAYSENRLFREPHGGRSPVLEKIGLAIQ